MNLRWNPFLCALGLLLATIGVGLTAESSHTGSEHTGSEPKELKHEGTVKAPCKAPLENNEEAEKCLAHQFATEHDTLYSFADHAGHLGNVADCSTAVAKSYFSTNKVLFQEALSSINNIKCGPDRREPDAYFCHSTINSPKTLACSKEKKSTKVAWVIGKTIPNLKTFFIN